MATEESVAKRARVSESAMTMFVFGDRSVGKSSLLRRLANDGFSDNYSASKGCVSTECGVSYPDLHGNIQGLTVEFIEIYCDLAESESESRNLLKSNCAAGFIFVYDVGSEETFDHINILLQEVEHISMGGGKEVVKLLVGNKLDQSRVVPREQADEWARSRGMLFMETSAKTDSNVIEAFSLITGKASLEKDWKEWRECVLDLTQSISARTRAAFYLRTEGSERSAEVLGDALKLRADSALMRHELAYVLGQMGLIQSCDVLSERLSDESDDLLVRHECAEALGAIGDLGSVPVLLRHSTHPQPEIAETCKIALDLYKHREKEKAAGALKGGGSRTHHYLSVDPAPAADTVKTVEELGKDLMNTSFSLFERYRALFALRNIDTDESALMLTRGLKDTSALFRHEVAYVLGQMEKEVTAPALESVLRDTSEHRMVRHECAESLGAIGGPGVQTALRMFVEDEERVVGESCVVALDAMDYWAAFGEGAVGEGEKQ